MGVSIMMQEDITKDVPLPIKLSLQEQVKKPGGKIKLRCTCLEALRWQEFKETLSITLSLQEQVKKPGGKIKLRCTWLEALRWQEFKDSPNTRGL
jgi:hypothetical protein